MDLTPYDSRQQGWTRRDAAHLLWRDAVRGERSGDHAAPRSDGLEKTLERLLKPPPEEAAFAETAALLRQTAGDSDNINQLKTWWLYRMTAGPGSAGGKDVPLLAQPLRHVQRQGAVRRTWPRRTTSSARTPSAISRRCSPAMAKDTAMLVWLDGNANRNGQPERKLRPRGDGAVQPRRRQLHRSRHQGSRPRLHRLARPERAVLVQPPPARRRQQDRLRQVRATSTATTSLDLCLEHAACPRFLALKLLKEFVMPIARRRRHRRRRRAASGRKNFKCRRSLRELLGSQLFFSGAAPAQPHQEPGRVRRRRHTARSMCAPIRQDRPRQIVAAARARTSSSRPPSKAGTAAGSGLLRASLLQRANSRARL